MPKPNGLRGQVNIAECTVEDLDDRGQPRHPGSPRQGREGGRREEDRREGVRLMMAAVGLEGVRGQVNIAWGMKDGWEVGGLPAVL